MARAGEKMDGNAALGRLVPDCGGLIRQIALSLPAAFFDDAPADTWFQPLVPIGNLLTALPADVEALLLVEPACLIKAKVWADSLQTACEIVFVSAAETRNITGSPWIQDSFLVRTGPETDSADIEILAPETAGSSASLASFLRAPMGALPIYLPGGNQLVGPGFRLVGHSNVVPRGSGGAADIGSVTGMLEKLQALDERRICIFGYRTGDLSETRISAESEDIPQSQTVRSCGGRAQAFGLENLLRTGHQFGFHVDQFVSVTGLERDDRPILLVGEPCVAGSAEISLIENARRLLDASVVSLIGQGFEVLRNPVPFVTAPDSGKRLPRLYNNLILENDVRPGHERPMVWLPQFGDVEQLEAFDRRNGEVWEGLGFEVVPVSGWSYFASRNGALRCLSKVLKRADSAVSQT